MMTTKEMLEVLEKYIGCENCGFCGNMECDKCKYNYNNLDFDEAIRTMVERLRKEVDYDN